MRAGVPKSLQQWVLSDGSLHKALIDAVALASITTSRQCSHQRVSDYGREDCRWCAPTERLLTWGQLSANSISRMLWYSTRTAAKKLGIHFVTLQRYIAANKIPAPESEKVGGSIVRGWTDEDIERVRKVLPKIANGRKTRYQKLKEKHTAEAGVPVPHKKGQTKKKKKGS